MLLFDVYREGELTKAVNLAGAHLLGAEEVPLQATLTTGGGRIKCVKHAGGASALALLWDAGPAGRFLLSTTRLQDRKAPYNLNLELARARLMRLILKREDWGLFDYASGESLTEEFQKVNRLFIEAVKTNATDPPAASRLADRCLAEAIDLSERTALFHAEIFLNRRMTTNGIATKTTFGCDGMLSAGNGDYRRLLVEAFDFVSLPTPWKRAEPQEGQWQLDRLDAWLDWSSQAGMTVHAGPLVSFEPDFFPEWLYIWEHDFETLREMTYEYIRHIVSRYAKQVSLWNVVSGVHAYEAFGQTFEQRLELTRMSCLLVKQLAPSASVVVDLLMPWGEYYARNQRTIPPMMYADMCAQSGMKFDAFGVRIIQGAPVDGLYVRDLLQISSKLDELGGLGKPLHVTACQVPSSVATDQAGTWRKQWDPSLQAEWLEAFYSLALSKPFVESVCWADLADNESQYFSHGGLCGPNMETKPAYETLKRFRTELIERSRAPKTGNHGRSAVQAGNCGK
ncbi:MAG: endo-1,4-beta-xylanase [Planctomycetes bacterium]|nr:endo-1,4-beta-xylanase [Planctomycetota bacterium]